MTWNWQHPDWPMFSWRAELLRRAEEQFLVDGGMFAGTARHLRGPDIGQFTVEALSTEAIATSEIEGEILDRTSVRSSILRHLGQGTDGPRGGAAEQGIAEMMTDLHRSFAEPLTEEMLCRWHGMLTRGRRDLKYTGRYREHPETMQVISGPVHAPEVHFEAPPSGGVPAEMARFFAWFNRTAPNGQEPLPGLTRAGIAHVWFVCIHPFEDGNGRIGRAIAEKALAQCLGRPTLIALAGAILARRKGYYEALARNNTGVEITDWLCWFAAAAIEAQRRSQVQVEFLINKTRLLDHLTDRLNERQRKALLRVLREGPGGFAGGLSARNYIAITGASTATATRDLAEMVEAGALVRTGERRHARYHADIPVRTVPAFWIDEQGLVIEGRAAGDAALSAAPGA